MIRRLLQTYRHVATPPDERVAREVPEAYRSLVDALPRPDRRHALATFARLRAGGADRELCEAGLLHDVGKPREARLWHRVAAALVPTLARRFGGRTLRAYLAHAERGAELARRLGLSERGVRLIARHHSPPADDDERVLAAADRE